MLWLAPQASFEDALALLRPYPGEDLVAEPVSSLTNNPRNEGPKMADALTDS